MYVQYGIGLKAMNLKKRDAKVNRYSVWSQEKCTLFVLILLTFMDVGQLKKKDQTMTRFCEEIKISVYF